MAGTTNFDNLAGYYTQLIIQNTPPEAAFMRDYYKQLLAYYKQNGLYDYINLNLKKAKINGQDIKPLRNPAWRLVEFYAAKIWPGTLPNALTVESDNGRLAEHISRIWQWGNFSSTKQRWSRWFGIYGDLFIKVNVKPEQSVYNSLIRPQYCSNVELDERGFLTNIRIEYPTVLNGEDVTYTELWNKPSGTLKIWNGHNQGLDEKISDLPNPNATLNIFDLYKDDFIPIVYQPFRDDGEGFGNGAYSAQLDKIDEINRQATRLAQMIFRYNRALWLATSTGNDPSGRPLAPLDLDHLMEEMSLDLYDDTIMTLPGTYDLQPLVPDLNYADVLRVIEKQEGELEKDLPELAFHRLRDGGELSGRAISLLLDDVTDRVVEVRGNAENALIRANQMSLTVGSNLGILPNDFGTFANGDFEHSFSERAILPEDITQIAATTQTFVNAGADLEKAAYHAGLSTQDASDLATIPFEVNPDNEQLPFIQDIEGLENVNG